jgi:membrane dipeptidase
VGVEHVGLGLDISFPESGLNDRPPGHYDPDYWWPKSAGYDDVLSSTYTPVETWQVIAQALQGAGMTMDEASLVTGGNMLRVARQVWS